MKLQNGYKVVYEKAEGGIRTFYGSLTGECNPNVDFKIAIFKDADYVGKKIYMHNGRFYAVDEKAAAFVNEEPAGECITEASDEVLVEKTTTTKRTRTSRKSNSAPAEQEQPAVEPEETAAATEQTVAEPEVANEEPEASEATNIAE